MLMLMLLPLLLLPVPSPPLSPPSSPCSPLLAPSPDATPASLCFFPFCVLCPCDWPSPERSCDWCEDVGVASEADLPSSTSTVCPLSGSAAAAQV